MVCHLHFVRVFECGCVYVYVNQFKLKRFQRCRHEQTFDVIRMNFHRFRSFATEMLRFHVFWSSCARITLSRGVAKGKVY